MKVLFFAVFALVSVCDMWAGTEVTVIPEPLSMEQGRGEFSINRNMRIVCTDKSLTKGAEIFSGDIEGQLGFRLPVSVGGRGDMTLCVDENLSREEYVLEVSPRKVMVRGGSSAGVFYALQTMKQLLKEGKIPAVKIEDKPHFSHRGTHLDVARHFFTVDEVKAYIDILALHKMNRFHWHLTDDQGWRVEIKKHPGLVEKGSVRKETLVGHISDRPYKYDGKPHGGHYTQEEIKDVVAYAADRHIVVIPEIDLPGHMLAALAAYPELGCKGGPYEIWGRWGISKDVLCAGNEDTYRFLEDVLTEICDMFPSELIHIGGDECPKDSWRECPKCQAKIKSLGLKATKNHSAEHYLQNHVMSHMEKFLNRRGRRIIGWDEILQGEATKTATIMVWRDQQHAVTAARRGNDVILSPRHYCYYDYCQTSQPETEPLCVAKRYLSMRQAYMLEPYDRMFTHDRERILGVQANIWTEYIADFKRLQHALLPRLAALSETAWAYDRKDSYEDFAARAKALLPGLYKTYGYNYAPYFFEGIE